ncbi:hypothetical protein BDZ97DRAFT_1918689 [Flammula alnicola]|nr:hypothetical protein BDZ97DRAFT_1918689 [Flammula alnicola]
MQELCFPFSICEEECSICEFQEKQPLRRIALSLIKKFKKAVSHCLCLTKGIAAMITNTRIDKYTDPSSKIWNATTSAGATIKPALDFATTLSTSTSGEAKYAPELYPHRGRCVRVRRCRWQVQQVLAGGGTAVHERAVYFVEPAFLRWMSRVGGPGEYDYFVCVD